MPPVALEAPPVPITRDVILQHAQKLPAAPQVLGGLFEMLEDVNTDLDQIAAQIRVDPALSARVLRISNSAAFGSGSVASSIEEAVSRVGFAEITRLVGVATVVGLADKALQAYGISAMALRESLLLHALASEALAQRTMLDPRAAYAGGLLRSVGVMILERVAQAERRGQVEPFDPKAGAGFSAWERIHFGITSVEVATSILDEWRFPHELVVAIERHLAPEKEAMAAVLHLAGAMVVAHRRALPGEARLWTVTPRLLAMAGVDMPVWQEACAEAGKVFDHLKQALY